MRHKFIHEFDDDPQHGDFEVELDLPSEAKVRFDLDGKGIWLSANRAGWLHLARICAEMGLHSQSTPGYHFHRTRDWNDSVGADHEVTFELAGDEAPV